MYRLRWFIHPILILVFSILAVVTSLVFYIYWYVEVSAGLEAVINKASIDPGQVLAPQTWVVILVLSILVGIILMGIFLFFVYNHKTFQLYRLQRNFINNFTHELKTPVTSLKLYLETFRKYDLSRADQLKYLDYMLMDADRLSNNISRILNLAKIESKTFEGEFVPMNLVATLENFYQRNKHIFNGCEITFHNPSQQTFTYLIDLPLFEILLMNLMNNAIKYNESKQPSLDITFQPRGRSLHILFKDNGIGMPPRELKKIFRKFYQIGRSENMSAKGSGLGLYLVDSITRMHKGKITADSKGVGHGSVFSLVLPLNRPGWLQ